MRHYNKNWHHFIPTVNYFIVKWEGRYLRDHVRLSPLKTCIRRRKNSCRYYYWEFNSPSFCSVSGFALLSACCNMLQELEEARAPFQDHVPIGDEILKVYLLLLYLHKHTLVSFKAKIRTMVWLPTTAYSHIIKQMIYSTWSLVSSSVLGDVGKMFSSIFNNVQGRILWNVSCCLPSSFFVCLFFENPKASRFSFSNICNIEA